MATHRRPTMADVAARAGVSLSTVSLSYSGAGPLSDDMRARVLKAAEELGYAGPSPQGRALRSGRSHIIGLVIHEKLQFALRDPLALRLMDALIGDLGEMGMGVLLLPSPAPDATERSVLETAPMDAAVVTRVRDHDDPSLEILRRRGIPTAIMEGSAPGAASVAIDDTGATAQLIRHLVDLGHERIATVTLARGHETTTDIVERAAFEEQATWNATRHRLTAFDVAGIEPCVIVETRASMVEEGIAAGHLVLGHESRPTAVVCQSDLLAGGVILAARELDMRVPHDVSVTGFDGLDLPWLAPHELTTVHQDGARKGHLLAECVRTLLEGGEPPVVDLDLEVILGDTTARPRS